MAPSLQLDTTLLEKLEQLYTLWATLRPDSTDEQFDAFGAYFSEDCMAWLASMRDWANPTKGRHAVINEVKAKTKLFYFEQRDVVSRSLSEDGRKVSLEGKARMNVMGKTLDNMFETVVATYDQEDLVSDLKVYTCRSHLVLVMQGMTNAGPYSKEYHTKEWQQFLAEEAQQAEVKKAGDVSGSCCP